MGCFSYTSCRVTEPTACAVPWPETEPAIFHFAGQWPANCATLIRAKIKSLRAFFLRKKNPFTIYLEIHTIILIFTKSKFSSVRTQNTLNGKNQLLYGENFSLGSSYSQVPRKNKFSQKINIFSLITWWKNKARALVP